MNRQLHRRALCVFALGLCVWLPLEPASIGRAHPRRFSAAGYEVKIEELRTAPPQDHNRLAAEKLFAEAERLYAQKTAQSIRAAIEKFKESLPFWRAAGDRLWEAQTLQKIGLFSDEVGEKQQSLDYYLQALSAWRAADHRQGQATTLNGLGVVYNSVGERQKALDCYSQALALLRAIGSQEVQIGITLSGMARIHHSLGEMQKALDHFDQALRIRQAAKDQRGEAQTLTGIGIIYSDLGEKQQALDYFDQALPRYRAVKDPRGEASILTNLGATHSALGDYPKALAYLNQAITLLRTIGDRFGEGYALGHLGRVYELLDRKEEALSHFNQSLDVRRIVRDRFGEAQTLNNIGSIYSSLGQPQKAFDHYSQALQIYQALSDRRGAANSLAGLARVERSRDRLDEARTHIKAALDIHESLRLKIVSQDLRASYFASVQESYQLYIDLLMHLDERRPSDKLVATALQASERARARSLLELLTEASIELERGIPPALKRREQDNRDRLSWLNSQLIQARSQPSPDQRRIAALAAELKQAESEREQLETEIRRNNPKYADIYYPKPLSPEAIQAMLDDQTALLEYSLSKERSYLFVVSRNGLEGYSLPSATKIEPLVDELRDLLRQTGQRGFGRYKRAARELYELLIAPADKTIARKRNLIIIPDGRLHYLPFEALLTKQADTGGRADYRALAYLLKRWTVSYAPSASALASLRQLRAERPLPQSAIKQFVAFADPVYQVSAQANAPDNSSKQVLRGLLAETGRLQFQRLPDSEREARQIARSYRAQDVALYLGQEASEETVKNNALLSQARRLHFSMHGVISQREPHNSALVLTLDDDPREDGMLRVYEIFNLKLNAELVVLSACETGIGKELKGEGVIGLTRAFFYAGAPSVAVSLWQVADRSTADLMIKFYQHLNRGADKAEALRRAKLETLVTGHAAHPYHWAPFVLIGESRNVPLVGRSAVR